MVHDLLAPLARPTITDLIVERLIAFIHDAKLRPGDKLPSERDLTLRLGVGRASLREAIKTLSALGFVDAQIGNGTYVRDGQAAVLLKPLSWGLLLGDHSTREVIEARRALEVALIDLAVRRLTEEDLATITAHWATMCANRDDADAFTEADHAFHLAIAATARNGALCQVLDTLRHITRTWIYETFSKYPDRQPGYDEHAAIVAALRSRDPDAARRAMADHLDAAGERLLSLLGDRG